MTSRLEGNPTPPPIMSNQGGQSSVAQRIPFEILVSIFAHVLLDPPALCSEPTLTTDPIPVPSPASKGKGRSKVPLKEGARNTPPPSWSLLTLSKSFKSSLEPYYYSRVSLTTTASLETFAKTLKARPDLTRKVKALWIAPISIESDFILALKPPAEGITSVPSHINQPLNDIRQILRSCRSLRHVALDGCLCTFKASNSFGSNCQPLSLVSINPYSFLGGFSTPMFRKLRRLEMCDTSLASEEVEQVRTLPDLCHFTWTSPREYSDAKRDVMSLLRILTPRVAPSRLQLSIGGMSRFSDTASDFNLEPIPVKTQPNQHRHLKSITIRTGQTRSAELAASLKISVLEHSEKLALHTVAQQQKQQQENNNKDNGTQESTDDIEALEDLAESFSSSMTLDSTRNLPSLQARGTLPYIDSLAHTSSILHPTTGISLQTCTFSGDEEDESIIDEWEYMRDLICGSGSITALEEHKRRQRERKRKPLGSDLSGQSSTVDTVEEQGDVQEILPGMALRRLWVEWCQRVESGALEVGHDEFNESTMGK
ncbi:unnamed protein product [Sympodiomycopsis kandeliae]